MAYRNIISEWLCMVVVAVMTFSPSKSELFTAVVHMEGLMELEAELLNSLNSYIAAEKLRLKELEEFSSRVAHAHDMNAVHTSKHLYDPINAFQLVNRYSNKWLQLHHNVYADNSQELMANISFNTYRLPNSEDFSGAAAAIQRLQVTYQLSAANMSSGRLGKTPSLTMSASDCVAVGLEAYKNEHWALACEWMREALHKYDDGAGYSDVDLTTVYDHLAFAEYKLGDMRKAVQYTRDLLQNEPNHERALSNLAFFESLRKKEPDKFMDVRQKHLTAEDSGRMDISENDLYEAICREGRSLPPKKQRKMVCYMFTGKRNPRLLLQPVKVEVVYPDPKIYVLHDLFTDAEMDRLKVLAGPKLERATVHDQDGKLVYAKYRVSKSGWLRPSDDELGYVQRIDQRIGDVTGLVMATAEQLQVVNYGIGGHYEPHYDFARADEDAFTSLGTGNRIATLLLYMSDVELGGATVFPQLGLRIAPVKGAAAFWWNLNKAGQGDLRTRHAGCPVLVGNKWVCNKWIHERGQEFRRPCGLTPDE